MVNYRRQHVHLEIGPPPVAAGGDPIRGGPGREVGAGGTVIDLGNSNRVGGSGRNPGEGVNTLGVSGGRVIAAAGARGGYRGVDYRPADLVEHPTADDLAGSIRVGIIDTTVYHVECV